MGKIKKAAGERHAATVSPGITKFIKDATSVPLYELSQALCEFPQDWPFPRGDLYHWIPLLDRFDTILELFNKEYGLDVGPQQVPFVDAVLLKGDGDAMGASMGDLRSMSHGRDDEGLVFSVLQFTRKLLEHCGNRSLYASSGHLNNLLHTTSLPLLRDVLRLSLRLAQRYQVARYKSQSQGQQLLFSNHYAFDLDRLQTVANPLPRSLTVPGVSATPSKGKEKAIEAETFNPNDLVALVKEPTAKVREELASVNYTYHEKTALQQAPAPVQEPRPTETSAATSTPSRRTSNLGPGRDRSLGSEATPSTKESPNGSGVADAAPSTSPKTLHIPASEFHGISIEELVKETMPQVPSQAQYDALHRIRIASICANEGPTALLPATALLTELRLLAVANLAYAYPEPKFQEKIGTPDGEEPRRYHLAQQLCDLLQPSPDGKPGLSLAMETSVLQCLEALLKCKHKTSEVIEALSIRVSHGVLYYELRRVVSSYAEDELETDEEREHTEWREELFGLVHTIATISPGQQYAKTLVESGIIGILVEVLAFRTKRAERVYHHVLLTLDNYTHSIRDAFQQLANVKGLDIIADLTKDLTSSSMLGVQAGNRLPAEQKTKLTDYDIPYFKQITLKQVFKMIVHMYDVQAGMQDRLLRNLVDSPQMLGALRTVIGNAKIFGSNVWSSAVNILSQFIHNEPTSYQVVAEAGLSKGLLESIIESTISDDIPDDAAEKAQEAAAMAPKDILVIDGQLQYPVVDGILPTGEMVAEIPTAFGAICLNEGGMKLFQASGALTKYFEIFVSPPHVRALEEEGPTVSGIGQAFDELSRHHPALKDLIMASVLTMVKRVVSLCQASATYNGLGAKLWLGKDSSAVVAGGEEALHGISAQKAEEALTNDSAAYQPAEGPKKSVTMAELGEEDFDKAYAVSYVSVCAKFLQGFFQNNQLCVMFCERGGVELILDLATSPSHPHDIASFPMFRNLSDVIKSLVDSKPHVGLPSLIRRTQYALHELKPMIGYRGDQSYFAALTNPESGKDDTEAAHFGTYIAKSLTNIHVLSAIIDCVFQPIPYTSTHRFSANVMFTSVNLTDVYIQLVDDLGKLHAACIWENIVLTESVPREWKQQTSARAYAPRKVNSQGMVEDYMDSQPQPAGFRLEGGEIVERWEATERKRETSPFFKNTRTLRFLLAEIPNNTEVFFSGLGQCLLQKRNNDRDWKIRAYQVADKIAQSTVWQMDYRRFPTLVEENAFLGLKYFSCMLITISHVMTRHSPDARHKEAVTLVLYMFMRADGFYKLNAWLEVARTIVADMVDPSRPYDAAQKAKEIITNVMIMYRDLVLAKAINESPQSVALNDRNERGTQLYFHSSQFLVEIRHAVLPAVMTLWRSEVVERIPMDACIKTVIEVLKRTLDGEGEDRAVHSSENANRVQGLPAISRFAPTGDKLERLNDAGFSGDLPLEALYRCNGTVANALDYCAVRTREETDRPTVVRYSIPENELPDPVDVEKPEETKRQLLETVQEGSHLADGPTSRNTTRVPSVEMTDADADDGSSGLAPPPPTSDPAPEVEPYDEMSEDYDTGSMRANLPADVLASDLVAADLIAMAEGNTGVLDSIMPELLKGDDELRKASAIEEPFVTVEDLDKMRRDLRQDLIERCLEVLSEHPGVTFALSELISAAVAKSGEGANPRADIGQTLVSSLISLQGDESGKKIASYAHLVALVLQDSDFFSSTLDELKEYFESLVAWVQVPSDGSIEQTPWLGNVLLIIERVLADDEKPQHIEWTPPDAGDPVKALQEPQITERLVSLEQKAELFERLIDLFPKVGKDGSLALSIMRVMVILTRSRKVAERLSEKHNLTRLFLMARQLAGHIDDRLQSSFLIVLRHLIEDKEMMRQIMRTEIKNTFDSHRSSRALDTSTYTRNMYHLVLRDPELFVEVSKDMLEIPSLLNPHRGQTLALKKETPPVPPAVQARKNDTSTEAAASVEGASADGANTAEIKAPLLEKPPGLETTDGVIQHILRELANYKDVEDQQVPTPREHQPNSQTESPIPSAAPVDTDMTDSAPSTPGGGNSGQPSLNPEAKRSMKLVFKAEEHMIYIYRCFLLQCLVELLASYNRTKLEFISFSRKGEQQVSTPSKPRSGTLNYLLNVLIPVGTLIHGEDIGYRKRSSTSNWAISTVVALCSKTHERSTSRLDFSLRTPEEEPELVYVRKFVLEHALRAFKDAVSSTEPIDQRYARLLGLADLFNRMLTSKPNSGNTSSNLDSLISSQKMLGKLMYEKNFIGALTASIAEIDLNFPGAKRAVKYILRPMKLLTQIAVTLSQTADLSSSAPGQSEEDEISSATSVSEDEDDREQTPDLFRNSTLGMLEGNAQDEESGSGSEDEDEELYGEGYDEEMDFEEGGPANEEDVISDDDDDVEGIGEIEGIDGDVDMNVEIIVDEDEDSGDDEEEDSDEGDEEDDGDDPEFDHMEEVTGDDENASLADGDEHGEWEDDGADFGGMEANDEGSLHGGPLEHITRVIGGDEGSDMLEDGGDGIVHMDMGPAGDEEYFEDEMPVLGEDEEEEEGGYEEEGAYYEPELEDEDEQDRDMGAWDWDLPALVPPFAIRQRHSHHHHPRGTNFGNPLHIADEGGFRSSHMRTHRSGTAPRGQDDGLNPLLRPSGVVRNHFMNAGPASVELSRAIHGRGVSSRMPESLLRDFMAAMDPRGGFDPASLGYTGPGETPPIFVTGGGGRHQGIFELDVGASFGRQFPSGSRIPGSRIAEMIGGHEFSYARGSASDEAHAVDFEPTLTSNRWQEEARIIFGGSFHERATRVINSILRLLVPPAMEAKRIREKEEEERLAAEAKAREEEKKKVEAENAERETREKKEKEEREAREAEEAAAREREEAQRAAEHTEDHRAEDLQMEGVETSQVDPNLGTLSAAAAPETALAPRVTTTIRGRELDITNLGIDLSFLNELPEDIREEVIMTQFQQQRSQAAEAGEQPNELDRDFLEALPLDIQQELLRQETNDRRRREQAQRRQHAANGNATAQPEEPSNADFLAMLDPGLRQAVLMEADENILANLPPDLQAEARQLHGGRVLPPLRDMVRLSRVAEADPQRILERNIQQQNENVRQRRPVVQMLDKAGVATLLRLMFVSLQGSAKSTMHGVLADVCKNTQNRAEVISILLSILQDGTADVGAVEKSFTQLTLRAKQLPGPKTPQPLKRTPTGQMPPSTTDLSPLSIVQQCLATLNSLTVDNPRVPSFFLSEHETIASQKAKTPKKGKGKENRAARFPLNALLTLLDRKIVTENANVMETLAALLKAVTHPLLILLKRAKEAEKEVVPEEREGEQPTTSAEPSSTYGDATVATTTDVAMTEALQGELVIDINTNAQPTDDAVAVSNDAPATAKPADKRKHRDPVPPEIPDENIRLVVNILAARECSQPTFRDTLDVIKNLSHIPGAKAVLGKELVRQAQELGQTVLADLEELATQINAAKTGTDLQGMALAKFSSSSAKQAKLLRVLTALDHIFDPKRQSDGEVKENILATLYESSAFEKLWDNLSRCLTGIRQRGNMINVATILMPLIECFLVVCKNSAAQDAPSNILALHDVSVSTPPPDAAIKSLFFSFTEEHRKILNELVRNNPKLLSGGSFSTLVNNSKVLEFDNKRTYFNKRLHHRSQEERMPHPSLQLSIRRDQVFLDSFKSLYYKSGNEIKYGKLNIRFHGEEGVDAGGVSREWFAAMARQMFNPDFALFTPVASDRTTFHPNSLSEVNPEHLLFFKFIGRIIGKALYEGRVLDCHFSRAVYKRILGRSVALKDMETLDLEFYKSLEWMLHNPITDVIIETFSTETDKFGVVEIVDLIPNGRNVMVTEENKHDYVRLITEHRLINSVEVQLEKFLVGFHEIVPAELINIFNEQELELLISGLPEIDVDDWKNNTEYHNYQGTSPQIQWFWRAVRNFDKEEKAKLLQFVTGTSKVPLNGFKELEGMNGFSKFNIHRDYGSKDRLPSSHTCFNQLDLPEYETYEQLRQQVYTAITTGSEYFGFA